MQRDAASEFSRSVCTRDRLSKWRDVASENQEGRNAVTACPARRPFIVTDKGHEVVDDFPLEIAVAGG
jgi:hypothetical protein